MFDIYCPIMTHLKKQNPLNSPFRGFLIQSVSVFVGMAGFEPTTSCSQSRRDTGLRYIPNLVSSLFPFSKGWQSNGFKMIIPFFFVTFFCFAVRAGFEPAVPLPVRQFSKLFLSASQAPHR